MDAGNPQIQDISDRLQIVMETYQKEFLAAIKRSNEEMQRAIAEASSSVAKEVQQATTNAVGESKSESGPASPMNLTELTGQLFEQTQAILNQLTTESAASLAEAIKPFGSPPPKSAELNAIDPRA
ncbi:MAG TPA: hypothetical protein DC054_12175, partial [Blastocatellia bacterium]|nr:hypothetical protein [Blastocatellia bacterium]